VLEARRDHSPSYQLLGTHARAFWDADNFVQAEWAYSRSVSAENAVSNDGGLTWQPLGQGVDSGAMLVDNRLYPAERQGHAYKLKGQVALGKLLGRAPADLSARAYFQRVQPGFFADGTLLDQGRWAYGADGQWQITDRDSARLRWDGTWTDVPTDPQVYQYRRVHREIATFQLRHRQGPFTLTGEYTVNHTEDGAEFGRVRWRDARRNTANIVAGQVDWQAHETFALFARQEAMLTADERYAPRWNDRLTTMVGTRIKLLDNLELNVAEAVKWNGENATQVGLCSRLDEQTDLYASERFQYRSGTWMGTTVVGASQQPSQDSRTYAEYQLDTWSRGDTSRGVVGANHDWNLMEGLTLSLGYERTQVLGSSTAYAYGPDGSSGGPPLTAPNGTPATPATWRSND
jgi:hypothetical protein